MMYTGELRKMRVTNDTPVTYSLPLVSMQAETTTEVSINEWIGQPVSIKHTGNIYCRICGKKTKKSFGEGMCYYHFKNSPESSECIIRPELCEGHLGLGRDPEWEREHHVQPHVVYLALSSGVKVGVTRQTQVPTRWIDQGASAAIVLARVPYRQLAGLIEVALKEHLTDKTPWQRMLKHEVARGVDLHAEKARIGALVPEVYQEYVTESEDITQIEYPVLQFPTKVKSLSLDKMPEIQGVLQGIKGQYWILDEGRVFNIRKHTSYEVELSLGE